MPKTLNKATEIAYLKEELQQERLRENIPTFDRRVVKILQIEHLLHLISKMSALLVLALLLMMAFSNLVHAQAISNDLFMVPTVGITSRGAQISQPQNSGEIVPNRIRANEIEGKGSNYIPPKYDAFSSSSVGQKIELPKTKISSAQSVNFEIRSNRINTAEQNSGTTATTFTLTANVSNTSGNTFSSGSNPAGIQYRWDFENDGEIDTYFSYIPYINHRYQSAGNYQIRLQVLDKNGKIYERVKSVTVAENTPPKAVFVVDNLNLPVNGVFNFDTALSSDSQYDKSLLYYRFDWDNDGSFDTTWQNKTNWKHAYYESGYYTVVMQAQDPEGAIGEVYLDLEVEDDQAPEARLQIKQLNNTFIGKFNWPRYEFEASGSTDDHTKLNNLRFRWDFNYEGSEDIMFDTGWSYSPKYSGQFKIGGSKGIRLQVMDEQGQVSETSSEIDVPWTENYARMAMG